jgi:endonuclease/exonuclease/phosphatase (EEP) superfamily protein YafD
MIYTTTENIPVITMGDFNDIARSRGAQRFKHQRHLREAHAGRGMVPRCDADPAVLRLPVHQFCLTVGALPTSFRRETQTRSDHFPMSAAMALNSEGRP